MIDMSLLKQYRHDMALAGMAAANQTSSGTQRGMSGLSGTPGQGTGSWNSLYDCAGYVRTTGV